MLSEFVKVATVGDVPDNSMVPVSAAGEEILLAKIGDAYFAIDDWCTHAAGMLDQGDLCADTFEVVCPVHEGMFDLRTGEGHEPSSRDRHRHLRGPRGGGGYPRGAQELDVDSGGCQTRGQRHPGPAV